MLETRVSVCVENVIFDRSLRTRTRTLLTSTRWHGERQRKERTCGNLLFRYFRSLFFLTYISTKIVLNRVVIKFTTLESI